jgi:hypothetical protein
MPTVTVTAAEGEKITVRLQKREDKASVITTQGFDESGNPTIVQAFGPKTTTWPDQSIDNLASETRSYTVNDQNRIIIEQG